MQSIGVLSAATVLFETLVRPELKIRYEVPLKGAAEDLAASFPAVEAELAELFGWHLSQRPTVMLIQNGETFRRLADHPLITAFAVPSENLIVLDFGKLAGRQVHFRSVLKHEVVHLFLHVNHSGDALPKWLEEGVAQWASEGVAELIEQPQPSLLEDAVLSGGLIPLSALRDRFPTDSRMLLLSYEESHRVVSYIAETYGRSSLIEILADIQRGSDVDTAFYRSLSAFPGEIERQWIAGQNRGAVWLTYLAGHLYQFLFFLGALLTVAGFVRFRLKKRAYVDDE